MILLDSHEYQNSISFQNIYDPERQIVSGTRRRSDFVTNNWKNLASDHAKGVPAGASPPTRLYLFLIERLTPGLYQYPHSALLLCGVPCGALRSLILPDQSEHSRLAPDRQPSFPQQLLRKVLTKRTAPCSSFP